MKFSRCENWSALHRRDRSALAVPEGAASRPHAQRTWGLTARSELLRLRVDDWFDGEGEQVASSSALALTRAKVGGLGV